MPIQDEKHEVVLFLCSHKDITKQKLHEEKEHEFARLLNVKKQQQKLADHLGQQQQQQQNAATNQQQPATDQQLLANTTAFGATNETGSAVQIQNQQHQNQDEATPNALAGTGVGGSGDNNNNNNNNIKTVLLAQESKLEEANEAELSALANQNALISMDEFELEDSGDENEFDDLDDGEDHDKHTTSQYSRRRSRAVLYQLSGHYGCRRSVNMKSKLKLNNVSNIYISVCLFVFFCVSVERIA